MSRLSEIVNEIKVIEKSLMRGDIEKAWTKHQIGQEVQHKDGTKWRKISDTGDSSKDWQMVTNSKDKMDGKTEATKEHKYKPAELNKYAKNASEADLEAAIKNSPKPEVREAAHQEIDRREREEHVQEKDGNKETDKKQIKKGYTQWL